MLKRILWIAIIVVLAGSAAIVASPVGDDLRRDFQASFFATAGQDVVAIDDMVQAAEAAGLHVVDVRIVDETIYVERSEGTFATHPAAGGCVASLARRARCELV